MCNHIIKIRGKDMSLMKCPECGHDVSSEATSCPNCGFPIRKQNELVSTSKELYVLVPRSPYSVAPSIIFIVLGAIFTPLIIGIILLSVGIASVCELHKNNNNPYNCAYYDSSKEEIILVTYNQVIYRVKPGDIIANSHPFGDADMYVKIRINGINKRINCGVCLLEESIQFKKYYQQMQIGQFNPKFLPVSNDKI